jgi:hypothetical protein
MRILADENVPEEQVAALRGDGHDVTYSRNVSSLGPEASDEAIGAHAEENGFAVLSTDVKDFSTIDLDVAIFVVHQNTSGGDVQSALSRIESLPFNPADATTLWLSEF